MRKNISGEVFFLPSLINHLLTHKSPGRSQPEPKHSPSIHLPVHALLSCSCMSLPLSSGLQNVCAGTVQCGKDNSLLSPHITSRKTWNISLGFMCNCKEFPPSISSPKAHN